MKKHFLVLSLIALTFTSCEEGGLSEAFPDLTNEEVVEGLKSALEVGTNNASENLHARDGYYRDEAVKIFLPDEAAIVVDNLDRIPGGQKLLDNTIESINRAAEDAANTAAPIFINAITSMTISDGFTILNGSDIAATNFLKEKTYDSLQTAFQPQIQVSLEKPLVINTSAEDIYGSLINAYNAIPRIPFIFEDPEITENTLSEYTTRKALDGLFIKVADEETLIRNDPSKRVNAILVRVFGSKE
jgi:hypothetical protein